MAIGSFLAIQIVKRPGKRPLLRCERPDGSCTIAEAPVGAVHDLAHFAVESVLGLERGFYGLLMDGMAIQDFDVPAAASALDIPDEAALTEHIVNLLTTELLAGRPWEDFNAELARAVGAGRRPLPAPAPIDDADLRRMRAMLAELVFRWHALPDGGSLDLRFEMREGGGTR